MIAIFKQAHQVPLTDIEKILLAYFEEHCEQVWKMNVQTVSDALFISNSTVVRFCQKLGMHGFHEFKFQVKEELLQKREVEQQIANTMLQDSLTRIQYQLRHLNQPVMKEILKVLSSDLPLYICGRNLSNCAAQYLQQCLNSLDRPSILISELDLLQSLSAHLYTKSAILLFSAHSDDAYIPAIRNAKQLSTITILITCEEKANLHQYCDLVLCSHDRNEEFDGIDVNSRIGFMVIVQMLLEFMNLKHPITTA